MRPIQLERHKSVSTRESRLIRNQEFQLLEWPVAEVGFRVQNETDGVVDRTCGAEIHDPRIVEDLVPSSDDNPVQQVVAAVAGVVLKSGYDLTSGPAPERHRAIDSNFSNFIWCLAEIGHL